MSEQASHRYLEPREDAGLEVGASRGVTWRAIGIGLVLACCEVVVISYSEPLVRSTPMNVSHFPVGFFMWFVAAVLFLNPILKRINVRYALSPPEFLTIGAMGLLAGHVPVSGLSGFFLGTLIAPFYFASPENRWGELLHPYIPSWLAPSNEGGAMRIFFESAPPGYEIPWHIWAVPLGWWLCLIGALAFALLCMAVMLRKQWVENERLVYPLISPVADLIASSESERLLPEIARHRLFRIGFGAGLGIMAWNALVFFWPTLPRVDYFHHWWNLLRNYPTMTSGFNIYTFGFGYFANVDVLFSVWLFYLIYWAQTGFFARVGFDMGPGTGTVAGWECTGGLFAMVAWALWSSRGHLKAVAHKALDSKCEVDDSGELLSYRTALLGFVGGTGFALFWFYSAGMEMGVGVVLILGMYVTFLGLAKVVSESGMLYLAWPVSPQALVAGAMGLQTMAAGSIITMGFTEGLFFHGKGMFMSGFAQTAKMADLAGGNTRRLAFGMGLALVVGVTLCFSIMIGWGYENGAYNLHEFPFRYGRVNLFPKVAGQVQSAEGFATTRMMFFGLGVGVMSLMTFLRYRFPWWPIHPIGFAIGANGRIMKSVFAIFWAWACKALILRIGGVVLYQRLRPFFVGLLAGYALGVGLSFAVDCIWFPGQGHRVHIY